MAPWGASACKRISRRRPSLSRPRPVLANSGSRRRVVLSSGLFRAGGSRMMRKWVLPLALPLACLPSLATAADFRRLDVSRDGDVYQIQALVYLAAPPPAVFAVLTDYAHFTRISASIV